jgi:hypothetical protein
MAVFNGDRTQRATCRQLDILAYGSEIFKLGTAITTAMLAGKQS